MNKTAASPKKLKAKVVEVTVDEPTVLVLRVSRQDGTSHSKFQWPESGPVECKDWNPAPVCGGGLHGLLWGMGHAEHLEMHGPWSSVLWQVVEVKASDIVQVTEGGDEKVKFPRGVVIYSKIGDPKGAAELIASRAPAGSRIHWATATAGDSGTATAGDSGTATAGYAGTATAGDSGTATAGERGTATAGYAGTATAGYAGTATAGEKGTATAGYAGIVVCRYWDDLASRYRMVVGYVGEDGIEPRAAYKAVDGKLVKVSP